MADCKRWVFVFFKQKTAYEMRISDWSSDVCSSDLRDEHLHRRAAEEPQKANDDYRDDRQRAEQAVAQQAENVVGQAFKVCLRKSRLRYEQACQQRQGQRARHERRGLETREQRVEPGFSLDLPDTKHSTTPIFALRTNPRVLGAAENIPRRRCRRWSRLHV